MRVQLIFYRGTDKNLRYAQAVTLFRRRNRVDSPDVSHLLHNYAFANYDISTS